MSNIVKYETDHGEVALSHDIVRRYLVGADARNTVTNEEIVMFIKLAQFQRLNPFLREVYLIKYGNNPASMVTGKDVFTKRAFRNPRFDGFEAGVTVQKGDDIIRREGTLVLDGEKLIAGWAKVYLKNTRVPMFGEATMKEFGKNHGNWRTMPALMIRKVALVQALREAFPEDLQNLYDAAEMGTDDTALPTEPIEVEVEVVTDAPAAASDAEPAADGDVVDVDEDGAVEGADDATDGMTLERAKGMRFPDGFKYPDEPLTEVVKNDPEYVTRVIRQSKNVELVAALTMLKTAWEQYQRSRGAAAEADVVM